MEENRSDENTLDEFVQIKIKRRALLPWWIKVFCWLFMIFGFFAIISLLLGFFGNSVQLSLYGFETNDPLTSIGLLIISLGIFKGFTAYNLWFEKDIAIKLGKIDAIIGIVICSFLMLALPFIDDAFDFDFRLELVLLIPYLIKLNKIQEKWDSAV